MESNIGELGRIIITPKLNEGLAEDTDTSYDVEDAFERYKNGDWGKMSDENKQLNDLAVQNNNDCIVGKYETMTGDILIITEADRSQTTLMYVREMEKR